MSPSTMPTPSHNGGRPVPDFARWDRYLEFRPAAGVANEGGKCEGGGGKGGGGEVEGEGGVGGRGGEDGAGFGSGRGGGGGEGGSGDGGGDGGGEGAGGENGGGGGGEGGSGGDEVGGSGGRVDGVGFSGSLVGQFSSTVIRSKRWLTVPSCVCPVQMHRCSLVTDHPSSSASSIATGQLGAHNGRAPRCLCHQRAPLLAAPAFTGHDPLSPRGGATAPSRWYGLVSPDSAATSLPATCPFGHL